MRAKMFFLMAVMLVVGPSYGTTGTGPDPILGFQGYLTDHSGNPLNGVKDISFKLFSVSGTVMWTETQDNVTITDGFFNVSLGAFSPLDPAIFSEPLFLQVSIDGEILYYSQPLTGAPYAMTLVGGSVVSSNITGSEPNKASLSAVNSSNGTALGLLAMDGGDLIRGCSGEVTGGMRDCPDLEFQVKGDGQIVSDADTIIGISAMNMVSMSPAVEVTFDIDNGLTRLIPDGNVASSSVLPVDLPITLFDTPMKVANLEICYRALSFSFITQIIVLSISDTGNKVILVDDGTDRQNDAMSCFSLSPSIPTIVESGLSIYFIHQFENKGVAYAIDIGKVTITLTED